MKTIGIILAGGKSTRMGSDKALLQFHGKSLLDHSRDLLRSLELDQILVLGRTSVPDGVEDTLPHSGPATSLCAWLKHQTLPIRILVVPVDMPLLAHEQLSFLLSIEAGAYFEDQYLPFVATVKKPLIQAPDRMKTLLELLGAKSQRPPKKWLSGLKNINTPAALTEIIQQN